MEIKEFNSKYGRLVLIVFSVSFWIAIIWSFIVNGYLETWANWHIPAALPPFLDFRLIPSGAETFRSGIDPAISNPFDPLGNIFNYPKIWYIFFYTGITQADTIWLSILLIVLFFLVVFVFPEKLFITDAFLTLVIVFSPAAMLLYERGNVDLIFFVLCGLSIMLVERSPVWAVGVLSVGAMFKFFPFFGVGIFLQENRNRFYKYFFASLLVFLIYVVLSFDSLTAAWNLTERRSFTSYGVYIIFDLLKDYFRYYLLKVISKDQVLIAIKWLPHLSALVFLITVFLLGLCNSETLKADSKRNLIAFRMGALIYVGTFLFGHNWDYRLAFLIFTVPQFSQWISSCSGKQRWIIVGVFVSLLFSCWFMFVNYYVMLISDFPYEFHILILDEVMNWILFGGLAYLVFVSAPRWFRTFAWFGQINEQA